MPAPLLRAVKEMYQDDGYILIDENKRAHVHPANGVKQAKPALFIKTKSSLAATWRRAKPKMLSASKIPKQDFMGDLRYRQHKVWREADALSL
eukprot:1137269-Pelagomonas_calceolata.AAC.2